MTTKLDNTNIIDHYRKSVEINAMELVDDMVLVANGEPIKSTFLRDQVVDEHITEEELTVEKIRDYVETMLECRLDSLVCIVEDTIASNLNEEQQERDDGCDQLLAESEQTAKKLTVENLQLQSEIEHLENQRAYLLEERFAREYRDSLGG